MIHNSKTLAHRLGATLFAISVATIAPMSVAEAATLPVRVTQTENGGKLEISLGGAPFRVETNAPRTLDITVLGQTEGFDLSAVPEDGFGGVSSARSERTPQGARLRLVLNCDCQYGASVNDGLLGIDISLRTISTAADDPPFENPKASLRSRIGGTKYAPLRAPAPLAKRSTPTSESFSKASSDEVSNEVSISNDDAKERQEDVKLARKRLLEQLTRAADQGLLKFEGDAQTDMRGVIPSPNAVQIASNGDSAGETSEVDSNSEAVESATAAEESDATSSVQEPPQSPKIEEATLRARTASDIDFRKDRRDTRVFSVPCPDPKEFDLPNPSNDGDFFSDIGKLRAQVVDDLGDPNVEAIISLAKLYVAHGFGAEARVALQIAGGEDTSGRAQRNRIALVNDMARIVDGDHPSTSGLIAKAAPCGGVVGLWAEAGGVAIGDTAKEDTFIEKMIEAFDRMPAAQRELLGPQLLLSRIGKEDLRSARILDDILRRTPLSESAEARFSRARLLEAEGDLLGSRQVYSDLINDKTPTSNKALLALAATHNMDDLPSSSLVEDLRVAAFLHRDARDAAKFEVAVLRAESTVNGPTEPLSKVTQKLDSGLLNEADRAQFRRLGLDVVEAWRPKGVADRLRDESIAIQDRARFSFGEALVAFGPHLSEQPDADAARAATAMSLMDLELYPFAAETLANSAPERSPAIHAAVRRLNDNSPGALERARKGEAAQDVEAVAIDPRSSATEPEETPPETVRGAIDDGTNENLSSVRINLERMRTTRQKIMELLNDG